MKFLSRRTRNQFFSNRNKLKGKTAKDIKFNGCDNKIYVNESLTRHNGNIFRATRNQLRPKGYKYIWTVNGVTMARANDKSETIAIKSITDLDNL